MSKLPGPVREILMGLQQQPPVNAIPPEYTRQKLPEIDPVETVSDVWWWW